MNVKGLLRHSRDFTRGLSILKNIPIALRGGEGENILTGLENFAFRKIWLKILV